MDLSHPPQSQAESRPLTHDEIIETLAARWLDKIFKMLLPPAVFKRQGTKAGDRYIKKWLLDHQIATAVKDGVIVVLREKQVFAVWNPELLPDIKSES